MQNNIIEALKKLPDDDTLTIRIYLGNFKKYGGSTNINKKKFFETINNVYFKISTNYLSESLKTYKLFDKELQIKYDDCREVILYEPLHSIVCPDFCISVVQKKIFNDSYFPIVNKYTSIYDIKIKKYICGDSFCILFIEKNQQTIRNIIVEFLNTDKNIVKCTEIFLEYLIK